MQKYPDLIEETNFYSMQDWSELMGIYNKEWPMVLRERQMVKISHLVLRDLKLPQTQLFEVVAILERGLKLSKLSHVDARLKLWKPERLYFRREVFARLKQELRDSWLLVYGMGPSREFA